MAAWRHPHWSDRRERLVEAQHGRAVAGAPSVDPDEPDPLASFRSQWLNIWPPRIVAIDGRGEPLLPEGSWPALTEYGLVPPGELVLGLEDWFGQGAAAAAAGRLPDGRLFAWGSLHPRRSEACGWLSGLADAHPESRLVIGASLEHDPDAAGIPVEARELAGQARDSRRAAVAARARGGESSRARRRRGTRAARSRAAASSSPAPAALQVAPGPQRTDLLRAAAWALAVLARLPVPEEEPAIF